ncbi:hypothetical protein ABL78_8161 [Leptomonas seymouri]|uniref:Uncharacterized protein n=1 Tax=Leptomonas seymouri TaxID=5684 RepID=A0A0N1PB06_LEPSE|nr:hypothetical protein ABL78_8161 [Leptomonas seymouri]|eukprot:KPI82825.1 hypothetical protein ABL78_8161 [Leptomonas seymouri]
MQSCTPAQSLDEVDEETRQALLLHLGAWKSATGATDSASTEAPIKLSEGLAQGPSVGQAANQPDSAQLSDNSAQGLQRQLVFADGCEVVDIPEYALPDAQYIERTVLPLLLRGLEEVALTRPPDPLAFLGAYLISNNPQKPSAAAAALAGAAPVTSGSGCATRDGGRDGAQRGTPAQVPAPSQQRQSSPLLPTEHPALAAAVQHAVERFAPYAKGVNGAASAAAVP